VTASDDQRREIEELRANQRELRRVLQGADELDPEFFVTWDSIEQRDVSAFEQQLTQASSERDMQAYLEAHPTMLIQQLGGGAGRYVIPHQRLGAEHVPDFLIGERDSDGFHWTAVELEDPTSEPYTKKGGPAQSLNHAIRQIQDWRAWLTANRDYATRPMAEQGLGLVDIDGQVPGLILIGRREMKERATKGLRRQMRKDLDIEIHTYDFLLDAARGRVKAIEEDRQLRQSYQRGRLRRDKR